MPKPTEPASGAEVDEAIRTLTEASQPGNARAQRVVAASQSFFSDAAAANRQLLHIWSSGLEATLKASFDAQNDVLATAPRLLESVFGVQKSALDACTAVARQQQATLLRTLRLVSETTDKFSPPTA